MGFNRIEAKVAAKTSMRLTRPSVMLVTLVHLLLTTVLTLVLLNLIYNPLADIYVHVEIRNYELEETLEYILQTHFSGVVIFSLLYLFLQIYSSVMDVGYTSYGLRMARGEQPGFINLFDGFAKLGRVLWMNLLIWLYTMLWSLLAMVPAVFVAFGILYWDWNMNTFTGVYTLLVLAGVAVRVIITYRYRLAAYFLIDDPACTAREAIRRSKEAMRGWKMELFTLDISFIGWYYLSVITAGILLIWLLPYRQAAEANFYDCVTATPPSTGGYVGPDYDYRSPDGPQSF